MKPRCFDNEEQYYDWIEMGLYAITKSDRKMLRVNEHCFDCTPKYQHEMRCQGRCDYPETKFVIKSSNDGIEVIGMRRLRPHSQRKVVTHEG